MANSIQYRYECYAFFKSDFFYEIYTQSSENSRNDTVLIDK